MFKTKIQVHRVMIFDEASEGSDDEDELVHRMHEKFTVLHAAEGEDDEDDDNPKDDDEQEQLQGCFCILCYVALKLVPIDKLKLLCRKIHRLEMRSPKYK